MNVTLQVIFCYANISKKHIYFYLARDTITDGFDLKGNLIFRHKMITTLNTENAETFQRMYGGYSNVFVKYVLYFTSQ